MTSYRANTPRFVDETVDGEALIMDMVRGTYYSCVGSSTVAWNSLKIGVSPADIAAALSSAHDLPVEAVEADVNRFVAQLLEEEALVESSAVDPVTAPAVDATHQYAPLQLERYTDLADLILLDPVHDVTDAGWPNEPS